jgi:hypothetical protein
MKGKGEEPLRGDVAWRAEVKVIARRNEAARAAGARRRAAQEKRLIREAAARFAPRRSACAAQRTADRG